MSIASKTGYLVKNAISTTRSRKYIGLVAHEGGVSEASMGTFFSKKPKKYHFKERKSPLMGQKQQKSSGYSRI